MITNPIFRGMYPDPSAVQVGEYTYIVFSTFTWMPGLPIYRSKDLVDWEFVGHALTESGPLGIEDAPESGGIFAPTLRYINDTFVLVCTSVVDEDSRSFVTTAADPAGPWSTPVILDGVGGIDPDIFMDRDGQVWWTGTRLAADPLWEQQTEIWTRPFDLETASFTGDETVIWHGAVEGVVWTEAPHFYDIDGWYYLLTAEGGTAEEHSVSIARSKELTGPWVGTKRNPIFTHRNFGRSEEVQYVGHADLFQRPDGSWWAIMLGIRHRESHHLLGRETFLCKVDWEDGWPVFSPGLGKLPTALDPVRDEYSIAPVERENPEREITVSAFLDQSLTAAGREWDELVRGVRMTEWSASIEVDVSLLESCAIGIVQDAENWLRVRRDDGRVLLETRVKGEVTAESIAAGDTVAIRLNDLELSVDSAGSVSKDARWLSTQSAGGFTGCFWAVWGEPHDPSARLRLHAADLRL